MWLKTDYNERAQLWHAMSDSNYDYISNGAPTYWPTDQRKLPDLLDFFVSHGLPRNNYLIHSNFDLSSDHTPVIVSLSTAAIKKPLPPKLTTRNTDWNIIQHYLVENTNLNIGLKSPADLDQAAHYFTTLVQNQTGSPLLQKSNKLFSSQIHHCISGSSSPQKEGLEESGNDRIMQTTSTSITNCPDT